MCKLKFSGLSLIALLGGQFISARIFLCSLTFAHTGYVLKQDLPPDNWEERGENKAEANISLYAVLVNTWDSTFFQGK